MHQANEEPTEGPTTPTPDVAPITDVITTTENTPGSGPENPVAPGSDNTLTVPEQEPVYPPDVILAPEAPGGGFTMPELAQSTDSGLSALDIAVAAGSASLFAAGVIILIIAATRQGRTLHYWDRTRLAVTGVGALLLIAAVAIALSLAGPTTPVTAPETPDSTKFSEWVTATYGVEIGAEGYQELLAGDGTAVNSGGVLIEVHATEAQDGLTYLFNTYGQELSRYTEGVTSGG